jgi:predicted Zn finger-like uncharacterized protein
MVIVCRSCGARFRMTHALFQDAKGARIRCRKCGGHIEVRHPEASPVPPALEVPGTLAYEPAPTAFPEIPEVVPKEGPVTAPALPTENPLAHAPSSDALVPPEKPGPEKEAPMPEEDVFSPSPPTFEPGDTEPEEESKHAPHAPGMETVPPMDAPDAESAINGTRDGVNGKIYAVYRLGYWNNKLELVGKVVERRKEERKNNAADMLLWAQKIYAASSIDSSIFIVKEGSPGGAIFGGA